jgi:hypothetical protein
MTPITLAIVRPLAYLSLAGLALLAGCDSSSSTPSIDAPAVTDARTGAIDSPGSTVDGAPGSVDARVSAIDASVGAPDATPIASGSITLSGDQTGTFSAVAVGGTDSATGVSLVGVTAAPLPTGYTAITISVELNGALAAQDYAVADFASAAAAIGAPGNKFYLAGTGNQAAGTFGTLHLTSVEMLGQQDTTTVYTVHGSIEATLDSTPSGTTVMMSATF